MFWKVAIHYIYHVFYLFFFFFFKFLTNLLRIPLRLSSIEVKMKVKVTQSCQTHCDPRAWNSLGWNSGMGSLSLLQGIFPTQGLNPGLLYRRQILYQLNHKELFHLLDISNVSLQFASYVSVFKQFLHCFCFANVLVYLFICYNSTFLTTGLS